MFTTIKRWLRDDDLHCKVDRLLALLSSIKEEVQDMSQALDNSFAEIESAVTANTDATASAILLMNRIAALIEEAGANSDAATVAKLTAIASGLRANATDLGGAVTANTPST